MLDDLLKPEHSRRLLFDDGPEHDTRLMQALDAVNDQLGKTNEPVAKFFLSCVAGNNGRLSYFLNLMNSKALNN